MWVGRVSLGVKFLRLRSRSFWGFSLRGYVLLGCSVSFIRDAIVQIGVAYSLLVGVLWYGMLLEISL